jgi:hypothetical protein
MKLIYGCLGPLLGLIFGSEFQQELILALNCVRPSLDQISRYFDVRQFDSSEAGM